MSNQQRATIDHLLRTGPLDIGGDVEIQRPILDQLMTAHPLPNDVVVTSRILGGVRAVSVEIKEIVTEDIILFFHGGGYALGSATAAAGLAADLARRAGTNAISLDYRLAPEHPYPAAVDDAMAAYRALLASGADPARIALAGESAGAGLTAALLLAIKAAGLPQPNAAVLFSPWADLTLSGDSIVSKADADPALTREGLQRRADDYLGAIDPATPWVSPIYGDLTGLPPLLIQVGSREILLDDAIRLAARAAADDVDVTLDVTPDVPHVFQGFSAILAEGDAALTRAGIFLRNHLDATED